MVYPTAYVYEYRKNIFFFIMSRHPIDDRALIPIDFIFVDINAHQGEIGMAATNSISKFSIGQSELMQYQTDIIHKNICRWVGARGIKSFEKNYRFITITKDSVKNQFTINPYDNFNKFPCQWAFDKDVVKIQSDCTDEELGGAILLAFERSTYHPERKDPKYKESKPVFRLP